MSPKPQQGRYGIFGGQYVAETLMPAVKELQNAWSAVQGDAGFEEEFLTLLREYVGRPSPLTLAGALGAAYGAIIYLKREDLNHTGAHKINNCLGQALLAVKMGKTRLIAETGAGQHGVATATVAALLNLPCTIYMGAEDVERQKLNVFRMELLGAEVCPVHSGTKTLKDAMSEAMRDWVTNVDNTYYLIGSVAGPHPYPEMVREFQSIIGREARKQILEKEGRLPDVLVACVGGGSNAAGLFSPFEQDLSVRMVGIEAGGHGVESGRHAATLSKGQVGVLHGAKSYVLCSEHGQISETHSISAGLDYPGVGPEHSYWKDSGRVEYRHCDDESALMALRELAQKEGIICALETAHAVAGAQELCRELPESSIVVICLSGRGDKDMVTIAKWLERGV